MSYPHGPDADRMHDSDSEQHRTGTAPVPDDAHDRRDDMHAHAATMGNSAFAGVVARQPGRFRASVPPGTSEVLALKKKPPKAPDAVESVGGSHGVAHFTEGTMGDEESTFAAGEKGFTEQMMDDVPAQAGKHFAEYRDAHLTTVKPTFNALELQVKHAGKKERMANDERGKHWWSKSIKSVEDHYENEEARWANKGKQWVDDSKTIMQVAESFNAAVPRANQMFVSLGRLEAMQDMLGVSDPQAMNTAVVASLKQAHEIADREKTTGDGGLDVPQANEKVTSSAEEVNGAQKMMNATWIGVQKKLLMATGTKIRAEGADAEKRQAEINKNIEFISNVGKTIDLSMSVMSGGKTMLEGTSSTLSKSQLDDLIADESASVMDTSGVDAAKAGGKKAASMAAQSVGLEIPTDVSSALETAGKIYYWRELETIRKKLTDLRNAAGKYEEVAKGLDMEKDIATYEAAVTQFEVAAKKQRDAVTARREAYLKFGAQIDKAAQNDPKALAKGQAPGKGQERFATVMAVTAAVRETLAMGNGALAGFGYSPNQIGEVWKSAKRNRLPLGWPDEEYEAVRSMHVQLLSFKGNVKGLNEMLGPIEKAAQSMMHDLAGGEEGAKPGGKDDKGQY